MWQTWADLPTAIEGTTWNRITALDYLMVSFQSACLWVYLLFILKDKKWVYQLLDFTAIPGMFKQIVPEIKQSQKHQVASHSCRFLEHLAIVFNLLCYLNILGRKKKVYTCPAARTLPSVEKVQQSPLFRGATCTGYSSSILQNLTILKREEQSIKLSE